jgi:hypothetical protein
MKGGTEKTTENHTIAGFRSGIQTQDVSNTKQECYISFGTLDEENRKFVQHFGWEICQKAVTWKNEDNIKREFSEIRYEVMK